MSVFLWVLICLTAAISGIVVALGHAMAGDQGDSGIENFGCVVALGGVIGLFIALGFAAADLSRWLT